MNSILNEKCMIPLMINNKNKKEQKKNYQIRKIKPETRGIIWSRLN